MPLKKNSLNLSGIHLYFVYTQLNVKTVLFETIQFNLSTVSMLKTVLFQTILFSISIQCKSKYTV